MVFLGLEVVLHPKVEHCIACVRNHGYMYEKGVWMCVAWVNRRLWAVAATQQGRHACMHCPDGCGHDLQSASAGGMTSQQLKHRLNVM